MNHTVENGGGFASLREFWAALRAYQFDGRHDPRLAARAPTGLNETDPTAGGFLVPAQWADGFFASMYENSVLAPLTEIEELDGPLVEFNIPGVDETSRVDGSRWGGVQAFWSAEASTVTSKRPKAKMISFAPHKLTGVAYVTNEMLKDSAIFEGFIRRAFGAELGFKLDQAIFAGTGAGTPNGVLNSGALIVIPKEAGQAAATILQLNVANMWKRLPLASRQRAVWIVNEDLESTFATLNVGDRPNIYKPASDTSPYPTLFGRPVIAIEQAPTLGSQGDILLADLSQYLTVSGPPRFAISADAGFLTDESIMRFSLRVDGNPLWTSPITPFNGTVTRSPFVTLAAR